MTSTNLTYENEYDKFYKKVRKYTKKVRTQLINERKLEYKRELKEAISEISFEEKISPRDAEDMLYKKNNPKISYKITYDYGYDTFIRKGDDECIQKINKKLYICDEYKNNIKIMYICGNFNYNVETVKNINNIEYDGLHITLYCNDYISYGINCEKVITCFLEIFNEKRYLS